MALSKFGAAFKAARKSGKKEFSFGGKSYNTKVKGEGDEPKKVPTPTAKPAQVKAKASASASKPTEAKASTKAEPKSKKVFSLDKPKSYTERSKKTESAPKKEVQGPTPMKATGIARKGSAMSQERARQENRPTQSTADMLKKRPIRGK